MRVLVQRVSSGCVVVEGQVVGAIGAGFVLLVGITHSDTPAVAEAMAQKVAHLRVFDDDAGKMNRSLLDVGGAALVVSQFTLYANARGGRRPDYLQAARPEQAALLIARFESVLAALGVAVQRGQFGAMMQVQIVNEGPVTLWLDSQELGITP
ncbi:D-aminoacyl-tRNA deacylase [Aggregatilineales bacterium SYSU G02658]